MKVRSVVFVNYETLCHRIFLNSILNRNSGAIEITRVKGDRRFLFCEI